MEPWRIREGDGAIVLTNGVRSYPLRKDGRFGLAEITRTLESTWTLSHEGVAYEVAGGSLVGTAGGREAWRRPMPIAVLMEQWRKAGANWVDHAGKPIYPSHMDREPWHLVYDRAHDLVLASTRNMPAAVVAAHPKGEVQWSVFVSGACCNFACVPGRETILFASSCGKEVTVLSPTGEILRRVPLGFMPVLFLADAPEGAVAAAFDQVVALDMRGGVKWKHGGE